MKSVLLVGGVVVAAIGLMCLPIGYGVSPKRDLSAFSNVADTGEFMKIGFALIGAGLIAVVLSRFVRGDE